MFFQKNDFLIRVGAGELFHYIAEKDALNEEEAAKFILQILRRCTSYA